MGGVSTEYLRNESTSNKFERNNEQLKKQHLTWFAAGTCVFLHIREYRLRQPLLYACNTTRINN